VRVVVSAGEASGRVMLDQFRLEMARIELGCEVVSLAETAELAPVFGFVEGLRSGRVLRDLLGRAEASVVRLKPDVVVLVSFSGLHLPLGRRLRRRGLPVLYLGPPQVWAWGGWRKRRLRQAADKVVCLFRFEEDLLRRAGVDAMYFGYPLLDSVVSRLSREQVLANLGMGARDRYVVFLPGSRPAEVAYHEPLFEVVYERLQKLAPDVKGVMVRAAPDASQSAECRLRIAVAGGQEREGAKRTASGAELLVVGDDRYEVMRHAECAGAVSGTVTAELALLGVPMVVCYHLPLLSRMLARALVRTPFFALPSILAGTRVVPEALEAGPERLAGLLAPLARDSEERRQQVVALAQVAGELGPSGAMERVCRLAAEMARPGE
jgi:lipid-A-disaccharide synthase